MNSDFSSNDIQKGMDVFDSTGEKIGSISDVYQNAGIGGSGGAGTWGSGTDAGVGDVIVEEIDVVSTPDYNAGGSSIGSTGGFGDTGTSDIGTGTGGFDTGSTGTSTYDTTGTAGYGSGTDISGTGTGSAGTAGAYGSTASSGMGTAGGLGTSATGAGIGTMTSTGWFKISEGGILGIGAKDLYIPFSAVSTISPDGVFLNCTKDQAEQQYQQEPDFLQNQDTTNY